MSTLPVDPTDAQIRAMVDDGREGPVVMLNLNHYRDRDEYLRYGVVVLAALESLALTPPPG